MDGLVPETNNTIHAQTADPTAFVVDALSLSTTGQTRGVNATTPQRLADMGGGATFFSNLVEVAPAAVSAG